MSTFKNIAPVYDLNPSQDNASYKKSLGHKVNIITHDRLEEIKMAFTHYDVNNDGYLNRYELRRLLGSFAIDADDEYAHSLITELGPSEFYQYSLEQLILLVGNLAPRQSMIKEVMTAFECLDPLSKGHVPSDDVSRVLKGCIRGCNFPLDPDDVDSVLQQFTTEGRLDYVKLMEKLQV